MARTTARKTACYMIQVVQPGLLSLQAQIVVSLAMKSDVIRQDMVTYAVQQKCMFRTDDVNKLSYK